MANPTGKIRIEQVPTGPVIVGTNGELVAPVIKMTAKELSKLISEEEGEMDGPMANPTAAAWITDELHPKDWGDTPPQERYDAIYPLEDITPGDVQPLIPEGVTAEWKRLTADDGLVYWHRVG